MLDYVPNHTSDQHPWFRERPPTGTTGATPPNNWRAAFGGSAWERAGDRYYLHTLPARAAGPELAQPRGARGDARRAAVLARPRGGRVPRRRDAPAAQGPGAGATTRSTPTGTAWTEYDSLLPVHTADLDEVQEVVAEIRSVIGDAADDRRGVRADRAARPLLRRGRARRAAAVQLPPDHDAVGGRGDRRAGRALRGGAAGRRVAELGARQPRPAADRVARRRRAGARGGDAPAHPARHADAVLRRRDRHDRRADPRRATRRGRDARAHADAVDRRAAASARASRGCRTATWRSTCRARRTAPMLRLHRALLALRREFAEATTGRCTRPTACSPTRAATRTRWRST